VPGRPVLPPLAVCLAAVLLAEGCARGLEARSKRSFDEIQRLVWGKTAEEVISVLGEPDSRQVVFDGDERWIWWNYTFLDGDDQPPEVRGRVVHLEIVFSNPGHSGTERSPYAQWRVDPSLGVAFRLPSSRASR